MRDLAANTLKQAEGFDVFLSYHWRDREQVEGIARRLREHGLHPFLDRWYLTPGQPWQQVLEQVVGHCRAVAVCIGPGEMGPWQQREKHLALDRQARNAGFPVIPVLLPGADPVLGFLSQNTWIDLRPPADYAAALALLAGGIRGEPPGQDLHAQLQATLATVCPYRGLLYFREEDAPFFFGRDTAIQQVVAAVRHRSFVAVVGASGSGKSSVARAGLVPQLRRDRDTVWEVATLVPNVQPLKTLAATLMPLLEPAMTETDRLIEVGKQAEAYANGHLTLRDVVQRILQKQSGTDRLLLVADQWEELYTLTPDDTARRCFIDALLDATAHAPLTVVLTLRGDFLGQALAYRPLSDRLQGAQINLGPMTRAELTLAITQPAAQVGLGFEPGLAERILDDVGDEPGHLPLLEFVLRRLWEERHHGQLLHGAYEKMGGLQGAVANQAEQFYSRLSGPEQEAVHRLFLQLVRPGEGAADTRRRERLDELHASTRDLVKRLSDERLLVTSTAAGTGEETVEVAHEALIHHWDSLKNWLSRDRAFLLWRERLRTLATEWQRTGRNKAALLRGPALVEVRHWFGERRQDLNDLERQFIEGSLRVKRRTTRLRRVSAAIILIVVAAGAGIELWTKTNGFSVRAAMIQAPLLTEGLPPFIAGASPSAIIAWLQAVDAAGKLDELGASFFGFPISAVRVATLIRGTVFLAEQGRIDEASRLAERALQVAKEMRDFESSYEVIGRLGLALRAIGRHREAAEFAQRASAAARAIEPAPDRVAVIAMISQVLARVGLSEEAEAAVTETLQQSKTLAQAQLRDFVTAAVGPTLVRLGRVEDAIKTTADSGYPMAWPMVTQELIDTGRLEEAVSAAQKSQNPFAMAIAGSGLAAAGRIAEAREITETALRDLIRPATAPLVLNDVRELLIRRVLLRVASPDEVLGFVRGLDDTETLALAAESLARAGASDLARQAVDEAERKARALVDIRLRARSLSAIVKPLAFLGDADRALAVARGINVPDYQAAGLADAALAVADRGKTKRAEALLKEVERLLPAIVEKGQQSRVWASTAKVHVRLGDYEAALDTHNLAPHPDDRLGVMTAIIRDDATRRNHKLDELFKAGQVKGLGRFGTHWP
jgi:tetratricopeptide (TPR) repeat protein